MRFVTLTCKAGSGVNDFGFTTDDYYGKITGVVLGGPAHESGEIEVNDVICAINGHKISSGSEINRLLSKCPESVSIVLMKAGMNIS